MSTDQLMHFIVKHYAPSRDWEPKNFAQHLMFCQGQGFILTVLDDDDSLVGLMIAYPVLKLEDIGEQVDYEGPIVYVELVVALKAGVLQALGFAFIKRFGMREKVVWKHWPFNVTKEYSTKVVRKHLLRKKTMGREILYGRG